MAQQNPPKSVQNSPSQQPEIRIEGQLYHGPIPQPEILKRFGDIDSSFPERIMKMAEEHNKADVRTKNRFSLSNLVMPIIGQVFTLFLGAGSLLAAIYLSRNGHAAEGVSAIIGGFAPVVIAAFANLRNKKR
jgi:uncharacterized membrane protein